MVSKVPMATSSDGQHGLQWRWPAPAYPVRGCTAAAAAGNTPSCAMAYVEARRDHLHRPEAAEHADDHDAPPRPCRRSDRRCASPTCAMKACPSATCPIGMTARNDERGRGVGQRHNGQPQPQRPRQRARRIAHLTGDLRDFPPAAEREERGDEGAGDARRTAAGAPGCRATNGTKWLHDAAGARERAPASAAPRAAILSTAIVVSRRTPRRTPAMCTTANPTIAAMATTRVAMWPSRDDVGDVAGKAGGECGRDAGVHHQQALPAVEEGHTWPVRFAEVHVPAASLGKARRERAVAERAADGHGAHDRPHQQHARRRRDRPDDGPRASGRCRRR